LDFLPLRHEGHRERTYSGKEQEKRKDFSPTVHRARDYLGKEL
jgi:hypothetical protein